MSAWARLAIEPTERTLWALGVVGACGVVSSAVDALSLVTVGGLALLALGVGADVALAGDPTRVRVRRETRARWRQGERERVDVVVEAPGPRALEVTDTLPPGALPRTTTHTSVELADAYRVSYDAHIAARGTHRFGRVAVRTRGPLGLVRRRARVVVDTEIRVEPNLARMALEAERLLRGEDGLGRRRRAPREGREFDALREYRAGDDVRLIEWKASARRRSLVTKTLRPEPRQDVVILVDHGRQLMGELEARDGGGPRVDQSVHAALVLGAAALATGDRVSLATFGVDVERVAAAASGRGQLARLARACLDVRATPDESDYGAASRFLLARQKRRALVVFVTDVLDEPSARALTAAVVALRGRHLPMVLALADPAWPRLADDDDGAIRLAARRALTHRRRALAALASAGAVVVDTKASDGAKAAVLAYRDAKAKGRL